MIAEGPLLEALEAVHSGRLRVQEAYRQIRAAERALPSNRDQVDRAVGAALFNTSNYPKSVQMHILGRDIGNLRAAVVNAVMELQETPDQVKP